MNEFLNPKSMLTPGVAGSLMMFLVNGIGCQFPELSMRYLALGISFLIGSVVWFSEIKGRAPMVQKGIYWVLNSLVIFVVGFGTSNLAADATAGPHPPPQVGYFLMTTEAQAAGDDVTPPTPAELQALNEKLARERAENERLQRELQQSQRQAAPSPPPQRPQPPPKEQFFKRW